jgi:hypothetical protein
MASLTTFNNRTLMTFRAGFASTIIGSFVNGLMPSCAAMAVFSVTWNMANPGRKCPVLLELCKAHIGQCVEHQPHVISL